MYCLAGEIKYQPRLVLKVCVVNHTWGGRKAGLKTIRTLNRLGVHNLPSHE